MRPANQKFLFTTSAMTLLAAAVLFANTAQAGHDPEGTPEEPTSQTVMSLRQAVQTSETVNAAFGRLDQLALDFSDVSGVSSGEMFKGVSLWANPYYSHTNDSNASTGYKGDTYGAFFGGDFKANDKLTAGLMFGVDSTDIKSKVNGGGSDTLGFTVAPYARYKFDKVFSSDFTFGYTTSNSDNDRIDTGTRVTGSSDTRRWFGSLGGSANIRKDRWAYQGRVGISASQDHRDAFNESNGNRIASADSSFGQVQIGATVSHYFQNIRPWASATYAYDYMRKLPTVAPGQVGPSTDRDRVVLGIGATIFGFGAFSGDISVKQTVLKNDYSNTLIGFSLSAPL